MTVLWKWLIVNAIVAAAAFLGGYWWHWLIDSDPQAGETPDLYLPMISSDVYTPEVEEIYYYIRIPGNLSIWEQSQHLADELSRLKFGRNPIEIMELQERNGRSVAIIDLRETEPIGRYSWRSLYFQGSTGGRITAITLVATFLQRDYDGEWIDGVQFLYEGGSINRFDHVPDLDGVVWRDST